ncbi:MAG: STAS domain-containing protein [Leptolyngbyaceae cyanobacterium SM1_3_5]|nr:STAS domain-containing protein [Leptolyngbyaceae cyanobacterium SM1_3_5]
MNPIIVYQSGRILSSTEGVQVIAWTKNAIEQDIRYLLLDLSGTSFMDSSGLGAIVVASKRARERNIKFALCSLSGQARMLLELSNMETQFEIFPSRQAFDQHLLKPDDDANVSS